METVPGGVLLAAGSGARPMPSALPAQSAAARDADWIVVAALG
jgi:ferredoxin-NADP reductase